MEMYIGNIFIGISLRRIVCIVPTSDRQMVVRLWMGRASPIVGLANSFSIELVCRSARYIIFYLHNIWKIFSKLCFV